MNQQYLDNLIYAKESLEIWISSLKQNNSGKQIFSTGIELNKTETEFAKWYYVQGQTFSSFEAFRNIENYYNNLHNNLLEYNTLSIKPIKKSLFSNNEGKRKKELRTIYSKIEFSYNELLERVNFFQDTLLNSPLFADSRLVKKVTEDAVVKTKSEPAFFDEHSEKEPNKIAKEKEFVKSEGTVDFININETLDKIPLQPEDSEVEGIFSFNSNELNEFLNQDPPKKDENIAIIEDPNFGFNDINNFILQVPNLENEEATDGVDTPFEIDITKEIEEVLKESETVVDSLSFQQTEEKKAILENSNTKKIEKKIISNNITPEIDIEEEIRRILS